jgi:hypothetical protein
VAAEPDITKKKKKRRRSARVYLSNAHPLPSPEQLAALVDQFPSDEDDGPAEKGSSTMGNPHLPQGRSPADSRVSPSRVTGGAARSTGDHGDPMAPCGPRQLAWEHPDLRQQSVNFSDVIARLRTAPPEDASRAVTYTPGEVALNLFNARGAAGSYPGMQPVGHSPQRPDWHQSRGSATAPNGSHSTTGPVQSNAVSNKAAGPLRGSAAIDAMRRANFPGSGGRR